MSSRRTLVLYVTDFAGAETLAGEEETPFVIYEVAPARDLRALHLMTPTFVFFELRSLALQKLCRRLFYPRCGSLSALLSRKSLKDETQPAIRNLCILTCPNKLPCDRWQEAIDQLWLLRAVREPLFMVLVRCHECLSLLKPL